MKGSLDQLTDGLDETCIEELGDPITYKMAGKSAKTIYAYVDHTDKAVGFNGVQVSNQDIEIELRRSDVPVITDDDIITLPQLGQTFNPKGPPRNSRDGRMVHIFLRRVRA